MHPPPASNVPSAVDIDDALRAHFKATDEIRRRMRNQTKISPGFLDTFIGSTPASPAPRAAEWPDDASRAMLARRLDEQRDDVLYLSSRENGSHFISMPIRFVRCLTLPRASAWTRDELVERAQMWIYLQRWPEGTPSATNLAAFALSLGLRKEAPEASPGEVAPPVREKDSAEIKRLRNLLVQARTALEDGDAQEEMARTIEAEELLWLRAAARREAAQKEEGK